MVRPTVASPDQNTTEPRDDDKISCKKHPSSFSDIGMPSSPALGVLELGISVTTAAIGSITGAAEYLAEGSKKVYINSQPEVRSNDRCTCEAKVTENCEGSVKVSNNVRISGESVVVRKIKSGKHPIGLILSVIMAARRPGKICNKIFCFATDFMIGAGSSMITSTLVDALKAGHPVHIPTGAKILDGSEELDFSLPAHLPFEWQRFYNSVDTRTHNMFGAGWSVGYEIEMEIDPQPDGSCAAVYTDEQGRQLEIEALLPNHDMRGINEKLTIRRCRPSASTPTAAAGAITTTSAATCSPLPTRYSSIPTTSTTDTARLSAYPALIAACVALKSIRYSSTKRCCFSVNPLMAELLVSTMAISNKKSPRVRVGLSLFAG